MMVRGASRGGGVSSAAGINGKCGWSRRDRVTLLSSLEARERRRQRGEWTGGMDRGSYDVFDATGRVAGQVVLAFASSVRGDIRKGPLRPGDVGILVEDYLLVDPSYKGKDCYQVLFKGSKDWYEDWEIEEVTTLTSQWEEIGPIQWEGGIAMKGDRPI